MEDKIKEKKVCFFWGEKGRQKWIITKPNDLFYIYTQELRKLNKEIVIKERDVKSRERERERERNNHKVGDGRLLVRGKERKKKRKKIEMRRMEDREKEWEKSSWGKKSQRKILE